jgi:hypothetical protein
MAQRNNADRCNGAALAQIAMLLLRARSAPNPLCAIGQRSRLTAPLGQKRTLTTTQTRQDHAMTDDKPKELTTTDPKPVRERRIPKRIAEAVRLLLTGECKTQKAAAERVGMNETYLSEALRKPHVQVFIERRTRETIANGTLRASARLVELIDSASEHVSADVSKHMLAIAGIKPTAEPAALVNINIRAGYVIDLSDDPPAKVIDVTPPKPAL